MKVGTSSEAALGLHVLLVRSKLEICKCLHSPPKSSPSRNVVEDEASLRSWWKARGIAGRVARGLKESKARGGVRALEDVA